MLIQIELSTEEALALRHVIGWASQGGEPTKDINGETGFDDAYDKTDPGYVAALWRAVQVFETGIERATQRMPRP
jgi:hypothetical protein